MATVLIVDDNTTLAYFTARNLQRDIAGLEVLTVGSCEQARTAVETRTPSVIIADFKLSDGNGIDLCREISQRIPDLAAILISGEVPPEPLRKDLFAFLLKPYDAGELVHLVDKALARDTRIDRCPAPEAAVSYEQYDRHKVRNLLGELVLGLRAFGREVLDNAGDPPAVRKIVDRYLDALCATAMQVSGSLPEKSSAFRGTPGEGQDNGGKSESVRRLVSSAM